jgi:hypothetical protein
MPTINKGSCVVSTYKTGTRTCPLKPSSSSPPEPFLYFVDTNLYYSVPSNTTLFVTCPADSQFSSTKEKSITISGIGEAHYRPACTITLPDGTYHKALVSRKSKILQIGHYLTSNSLYLMTSTTQSWYTPLLLLSLLTLLRSKVFYHFLMEFFPTIPNSSTSLSTSLQLSFL